MKETFRIPYPKTQSGRREWAQRYGMNRIYSSSKGMKWERKEAARYWHDLVRCEMQRQGVKKTPYTGPVRIAFYWNDRLDLDNHYWMAKMIVDGMRGRLLRDDNRRCVKEITHMWHGEDFILVEVEEV